MKVYKIWGSDYYDQLREKEFPLAVMRKMFEEKDRVMNQVKEKLSKPKTGDKVVVSRIQKTFMSSEEITAQANSMRNAHYNKSQARKNGLA